MKNKSIRSLFMTFIIAFSLGSYIFLNTGDKSKTFQTDSTEIKIQQTPNNEASTLPDIKVTKQMVSFVKRLLPVSN